MSLNINKNFGAMAGGALTALNAHQSQMGKSITRVSTGMRVNSPADDASAYLTSRRIKSDSDGYTALYNGLQAGSAKLNAVDSAVSSTIDVLNAMRFKALEYQSLDKNDTDAVAAVLQEYKNLNTVLNSTVNFQYNGENVLNSSQNLTFYSAITDEVDITANVYSSDAVKLSSTTSGYIINSASKNVGAFSNTESANAFKFNGLQFYAASGTGLDSGNGVMYVFQSNDSSVTQGGASSAVGIISTSGVSWFASFQGEKVGGDIYNLTVDSNQKVAESGTGVYFGNLSSGVVLNGVEYTLSGFSNTRQAIGTANSNTAGVVLNKAQEVVGTFNFRHDIQGSGNSELKVNILNPSGTIGVNWGSISGYLGGLSDVTDKDIVKNIKEAIKNVTKEQANIASGLGAMDYATSYLQNASNAQETAYTSITEADMAKEMTNYVKNNVYAQAAQAMIAQANQSMAQVLNLLQ